MTAQDKPSRYILYPSSHAHDPLSELERAGRAQEDIYFRRREQEALALLRAESVRAEERAAPGRCALCGAASDTPSTAPGRCRHCWTQEPGNDVWVRRPRLGWVQQLVAGLLTVKQP